ncbi:hypothetical protein OH686_00075 [Pseudomonas sp. SO81]|nr:hypothetical protein OH686_00075 [Pseudomonas sp. SO81]
MESRGLSTILACNSEASSKKLKWLIKSIGIGQVFDENTDK